MFQQNVEFCVVVLMVYFQSAATQNYGCSHPDYFINRCWFPMKEHFHDLDAAIIPLFNDSQLTVVCNTYQGVRQCVRDYFSNCHISYTHYLDYKGVDEGYNYVCNEERQGYIDHRNCFTDPDLVKKGDDCKLLMDHSLTQFTRDPNLHRTDVCVAVNNYLHCVENATLTTCGMTAAYWLRELDVRNIKPTAEYIGCTIHPSRNLPAYTTVSSSSTTESPGPGVMGSSTTPNGNITRTVHTFSTTLPINIMGSSNAQTGSILAENGALIGSIIALAIVILVIVLMVLVKWFCSKKKSTSRTSNRNRQYAVNTPRVEYQTQDFGAMPMPLVVTSPYTSNDALPVKADKADDSLTVVGAQPPPVYQFPSDRQNPLENVRHDSTCNSSEPTAPEDPPPYTLSPAGYYNPMYTGLPEENPPKY